ncbi:MAG: hypothetical protein RQ899_11265 [Pseudomonadales bacterium]|nr:hypothetical protein [Pseudomonadales bacterium]
MKTPARIAAIVYCTLLLQSGAFAADDASQMMQQHMQEMKTLMARIKAEKDPARLEALMAEHEQLMQRNMQMMSQGKSGTAMTMEARMAGMEQKMEMMQMMMDQMMQGSDVERKIPLHQHKR